MTISIDGDAFVQTVPLSTSLAKVTTLGMARGAKFIANEVGYDTGLLPPGTIAIRRQGNRAQYVLQFPPGLYNIIWGEHESDEEAVTYRLAMPFRVVFCEYEDDTFLGVRMFYTYKRIDSYEDELYHVNLPNINCRGYNGTSVGWVCLYHRQGDTLATDANRLAHAGLRASGNEAFNTENMSETDGPGFYAEQRLMYPHLSNPRDWEDYSDRHGWSWTLEDRHLWVPVLVADPDDQDGHVEDGVNLTVGMVMNNLSSYYYSDIPAVRPYNDPHYLDEMYERLNSYINGCGTAKVITVHGDTSESNVKAGDDESAAARLAQIRAMSMSPPN